MKRNSKQTEILSGRNWDATWSAKNVELLLVQEQSLPIRRLKELIKNELPPGPFLAIELGAGGSTWVLFLAGNGARVAGIDLSEPGLRLSRDICASAGIEADLILGDVFHLPFAENTFDVVLSAGLIEHFDNPIPLLENSCRLLRPGGLCITSVPNKIGLPGFLDRRINPETYFDHVRYKLDDLTESHVRAGFQIVNSGYVGSFSFGARAPKKGLFRLPYRIIRKSITTILWETMDLLNWSPETALFSPFLLVIGKRPE